MDYTGTPFPARPDLARRSPDRLGSARLCPAKLGSSGSSKVEVLCARTCIIRKHMSFHADETTSPPNHRHTKFHCQEKHRFCVHEKRFWGAWLICSRTLIWKITVSRSVFKHNLGNFMFHVHGKPTFELVMRSRVGQWDHGGDCLGNRRCTEGPQMRHTISILYSKPLCVTFVFSAIGICPGVEAFVRNR